MGSILQDIRIVRRNGEVLQEQAIKQLKSAVKCEVIIKGEASEGEYLAAVDRWNKGRIEEAVSINAALL